MQNHSIKLETPSENLADIAAHTNSEALSIAQHMQGSMIFSVISYVGLFPHDIADRPYVHARAYGEWDTDVAAVMEAMLARDPHELTYHHAEALGIDTPRHLDIIVTPTIFDYGTREIAPLHAARFSRAYSSGFLYSPEDFGNGQFMPQTADIDAQIAPRKKLRVFGPKLALIK